MVNKVDGNEFYCGAEKASARVKTNVGQIWSTFNGWCMINKYMFKAMDANKFYCGAEKASARVQATRRSQRVR